MTVTENDIIANAAAIATLINAGTFKTIADLDTISTITETGLLHVSESGADKNIAKSNLEQTGVITDALSTNQTSPTSLDLNKPHIKTNYSSANAYCQCQKEGVPYTLIMNYSLSAFTVYDGTSTHLDLINAAEVSGLYWANGLDNNIANRITAGAVFALTLLRTGTTVYATVSEMSSAAI